MTLSIKVQNVTPKMAKAWLGNNKLNRKLKESVVKRYARDMGNDNWTLTGEPIQFNCDGSLLNGQHRLHAIIESNKTVPIVVATGVDQSAMMHMDTGVKRSFNDWLKMQGFSNVANLGSATKFCYRYEKGTLRTQEVPTMAEVIQYFEANRERLIQSVSGFVSNSRLRVFFNGPAFVALDYFTTPKMPGEFNAFAHLIANEHTPEPDTTAFTYRKYMDNYRIMSSHRKTHPLILQAIAIKAWNAHIEGRVVESLSWRAGGASPEQFPTIVTQH